MQRISSATAFFLFAMSPVIALFGEDKVPSAPPFQLLFESINTDGEKILMVQQVPTEGEPVEQSYTVTIPVTANGVTKLTTETRTRTVSPTKKMLAPISDDVTFMSFSGEKLERDVVVSRIPKGGASRFGSDGP